MSSPIYTATAGPVDPKAPAAAKFYTVLTGILGLVGIASTFGLVTQEQAASLGSVGTAVTTLIGAVGTAVASFRTHKQLKNGTFDPAPDPVVINQSPVLDAFEALGTIKQHVDDTVKNAQDSVAAAVSSIQGAVNMIPGIANNPLVDDFLKRG
jgi:hypothetical protein